MKWRYLPKERAASHTHARNCVLRGRSMTVEKNNALRAYWVARTPDEETEANNRMMALGMPSAYA